MNQNIQNLIFKKFRDDLSQYNLYLDSDKTIWVIDPKNSLWFLIYTIGKELIWNEEYFSTTMMIFSIEDDEKSDLMKNFFLSYIKDFDIEKEIVVYKVSAEDYPISYFVEHISHYANKIPLKDEPKVN